MAEAPPTKPEADKPTTTSQQAEISAISIKIPPYWSQDPMIWFAQVESQFATRGISTERTRYDHVVAALPQEVAMEVRDVIVNPPTSNPYSKLKEKLLDRTTQSEQKRLHTLLTSLELGDRKPTQLLREMERLLGQTDGQIDQALFKELFLQRLPQSIRLILTSSGTDVPLETQARLADKMLEVSPLQTLNAVSETPNQTQTLHSLQEDVKSLTEAVAKLTSKVDSLSRRPSRTQSRTRPERSLSRDRTVNARKPYKDGLCYFHHKFGKQATKCQQPCNYHHLN